MPNLTNIMDFDSGGAFIVSITQQTSTQSLATNAKVSTDISSLKESFVSALAKKNIVVEEDDAIIQKSSDNSKFTVPVVTVNPSITIKTK